MNLYDNLRNALRLLARPLLLLRQIQRVFTSRVCANQSVQTLDPGGGGI
jgi:hypothetical protein